MNPNRQIRLQLSGNNGTKRLTIQDVTSGLTFLEVVLEPEALMELLSAQLTGSVDGIPAWMPSDLSPVGQIRGTVRLSIPTRWNQQEAAKVYADRCRAAIGAASVAINPQNSGQTVLVFRAYFEAEEELREWCATAQRILDTVMRPLAPGTAQDA